MPDIIATIRRRLAVEIGAVQKDHGGKLRVCLVYPNTYRVGMSSLGFQTIYHLLNQRDDVVCERAFLPEPEELEQLRTRKGALVSYETQLPLHQFDVIAFSVSFELDYVNIPRLLRLAKLPVMAADRGDEGPLIICGGAVTSINPAPLADLVDAFVVGEAETIIALLVASLWETRRGGRGEGLAALAQTPGVWVCQDIATSPPARLHTSNLDAWPTYSRVLTPETEFGELFLVEISRGCGRGCRFCSTPACSWPLRWRFAEGVLRSVREGLTHRRAIGLVGAAVSDHPEVDELATRIVGMGARLSVASLRADSISDTLLSALAQSGAKSITLAPEAGSERLRRHIGKAISDDQLLDALQRAAACGLRETKLYFMVGLPTEGEEELAAIAALARRCLREAKLTRLTVAAGAFVPKPNTPFANEEMLPVKELSRRLRTIKEELRREPRLKITLESPNWSHIESLLSRGDRRLGRVIAEAEAQGGNLAAWRKALGG